MRLKEETICTKGLSSLCHSRHILSIASGLTAGSTRTLYTMGAIHHHTSHVLFHQGNIAEVNYEVIIAVYVSALSEPYFFGSGLQTFFDGKTHILTREKLGFLNVHNATGLRGGAEQICLTAEECGNLQHVYHFACWCCLFTLVYICQERKTIFALDISQHLQALFHSRTTKRTNRCTIGLIERGFKIDFYIQLLLYAKQFSSHFI